MAITFKPAVEISENGIFVTIRKELPKNEANDFVPHYVKKSNLAHALHTLISQRVSHCENQLAEALAKGETSVNNAADVQIIFYKNGGHFSVPVYNMMVEFLQEPHLVTSLEILRCFGADLDSFDAPNEYVLRARGLCQQALRQLIENIDKKDTNYSTIKCLCDIDINDVVRFLTDMLATL